MSHRNLERETGIEPATSSLGSWRSTAELLPLNIVTSAIFNHPKDWSALNICILAAAKRIFHGVLRQTGHIGKTVETCVKAQNLADSVLLHYG